MRELARGSAAAAPSEAARRRLLLLPLVVALLGGAGYTVRASVCDTANCGKGNCSETPLPPNFECHCDPGWSNALKLIPFSPCIVTSSPTVTTDPCPLCTTGVPLVVVGLR